MSKSDKRLVLKKSGEAEERTLLHDQIEEKALHKWEKSPVGSEQNPQDLSANRQLQRSASSERKAELDLQGLKKGPPPVAEASPRPEAALEARRSKMPVIIPLLVVVLLGAFWLGYQYIKRHPGEHAGIPIQSMPRRGDPQPFSSGDSYQFYNLGPFFIPLSTGEINKEKFLKVTLNLAFREDIPSDEIRKKIILIRSHITDLLLGKSLSALESGEGKTALQQEIKDLVNASLAQGTVQHVYFEDFTIL